MQMHEYMPKKDKADLKEKKGIDFNASTIWRKTKAGKFPKPVKVGNRNGWLESEIDEYVESLINERDAVAAPMTGTTIGAAADDVYALATGRPGGRVSAGTAQPKIRDQFHRRP